MLEDVFLKARIELLPFGVVRHSETVYLATPAPDTKPAVEMLAGTTIAREIVSPEPARVIQR